MQAANQAQQTAASVTDSLTDLQTTLVELAMADSASVRLDIDGLTAQLSLIAQAAEQQGARALPNVTLRLVERLLSLKQHTPAALDVTAALEEWVQLSFAYLSEPSSAEYWQPLVEILNLELWKEKLSAGQSAILNRLFEIDARPAATVSTPAPANKPAQLLNDYKVAVLLEASDTLQALSESVDGVAASKNDDLEATVLAEIPHQLLQIALLESAGSQAEDATSAVDDAADATEAQLESDSTEWQHAVCDAAASDPTVQIAALQSAVIADAPENVPGTTWTGAHAASSDDENVVLGSDPGTPIRV
jgi:hypothetical protein